MDSNVSMNLPKWRNKRRTVFEHLTESILHRLDRISRMNLALCGNREENHLEVCPFSRNIKVFVVALMSDGNRRRQIISC